MLGYNQIYQNPIVYLIPSQNAGRNDVFTTWDLQFSFVRALPHHTSLQAFFALYNVLNSSAATLRDDNWTSFTSYATPIVNGSMQDLNHLKTVGGTIALKNEAYSLPISYQAPLYTRFGLRYTF